ncbi:alpha/beta hydrolase fold domain-containing protein [Actinoplanes sp. G11-F43]|uniref:alpha/beta hydrolase fold domain-containing protein n=1 Tax=Actinoplanes sp. G11-F43 TaxID=3424130 RepID=UPI003D358558
MVVRPAEHRDVGRLVMGDRFPQLDIALEWLAELGAVVVSVEYRLAPEATGTYLVEGCHRGLRWVAANAADLGVDPARIVVAGGGAGGGLAAGVTLPACDRGSVSIAGQVLIGPMPDHRTESARDFVVWTPAMNSFGWRSVLHGGQVTPYLSPLLLLLSTGCPRLSSMSGAPSCSGTRRSPTPAVWRTPNHTSGPAVSTVSTPCSRRPRSR